MTTLSLADLAFLNDACRRRWLQLSYADHLPGMNRDLNEREQLALANYMAALDLLVKQGVLTNDEAPSVTFLAPDSLPPEDDYDQ